MTTFARSAFNATAYSAVRPVFPPALFDTIYNYHAADGRGRFSRCVDLGCGTGQATTVLAQRFDEVIGVDPSGPMIEKAKTALSDFPAISGKVKYQKSAAEELPFLEDASVDLITASQAAHWFNYEKLWPELGRVLRPSGSVAFMGYAEMRLPRHLSLIPMISDYTHGKNSLGPYWEQPGRSIVENLLDAIPEPGPPFVASSLQRLKFVGSYFPASQAPDPKPIILQKRMTWEQLEGYVRTFSSLHNYLEGHPEEKDKPDGDIATRFIRGLKKEILKEGGDENEVDVEWPAVLILVKKSG